MLRKIKRVIRALINDVFGENIFITYHTILAYLASFMFGNPSRKMMVVAVTGKKGKLQP
jgi:hypothetical protein